MKKIIYICTAILLLSFSSCSDFLDRQVPQGTLSDDQVKDAKYVDNLDFCRRHQFLFLDVELRCTKR